MADSINKTPRDGRTGARRSLVPDILWAMALVAWVAFVWGHSLVPGAASDATSMAYVPSFAPLLSWLGVTGERAMDFVVRKLGHFSEYAVLGALASAAFRPAWLPRATGASRVTDGSPAACEKGGTDRIRTALALAFLVAIPSIDETIQLFVPGRSGMVTDVLLDLCGCATGVLLASLVGRVLRRLGERH